MIPDFPTTRTEAYLAAILGGDGALPVPESRTDLYLAKIAGMDTEIPDDPQTRSEKYLAAILGADLVLPAPLSRKDFYLAKKAGMDVEIPEPLTRLEAYLAEWADGSGTLKTVTGSLIHITDALASPVNALSVRIDPVQSGSGDPSPDNVRPISGWTGAKVTRTGKNLLPQKETATINDVTFTTNADGSVTLSGTASANAAFDIGRNVLTLPAGTYFASGEGTATNITITIYKVVNGAASVVRNGTGSFTLTESTSIFFRLLVGNGKTGGGTAYPMIELGAFTSYEPYSGTVIPVSFGEAGTVYGGTLDVLSGVLTVDKVGITLDGTQSIDTANYRPLTNTVGWNYPYSLTQNAFVRYQTTVPDMICDSLPTVSYNAMYNTDSPGVSCLYSASGTPSKGIYVRVADKTLTTKAAINAWLAEHPITVVYPLAEPQTIQLTPAEVSTLLGENNIWADTGDTTLTYMARG